MMLFLLGMPGAGKSAVGMEISELLKSPLIDLDQYITEKEKLSIPDIFKKKGEDYFRQTEWKSLTEIAASKKSAVVSLGGGTPCYRGNMNIILKSGISVYLQTNPEVLCQRIEGDSRIRPLFSKHKGKDLLRKLNEMISHREPHYLKAAHTIQTDELTPSQAAEKILSLLQVK